MNNLTNLVDEVYQAGDIRQSRPEIAKEVIEKINFFGNNNSFRTWDYIEQQISRTEDAELRKPLAELRNRFVEQLFSQRIEHVKSAFAKSPQEGWKEWLITIAEGVVYLRGLFCLRVSKEEFPFPVEYKGEVEKIRQGIEFFNHSRWNESYDFIKLLLSKEFIPSGIHAMLMVVVGQMELYVTLKPEEAKTYFDQAVSRFPDDGYIMCGQGDYYLQQNDLEQAKAYYKRGIELSPEQTQNYIKLGEIHERSNDLKGAEEWYQQHSLLESLLNLYGRIEYFESKKSELAGLVERAVETNPENACSYYITTGFIYETNEHFSEAHKWYQKAIHFDKTRLDGYIKEGYCYGAEKKFEKAIANFQQGIEYAPEASEGMLGLAWVKEREGNLEKAIELFRQCLEKWPKLSTSIRLKIAELYWKLKHHSEAIEELEIALPNDENDSVLIALENYAADYYKKLNDPNAATRIYDILLKNLGDSYRADYHNRMGNLRYYLNDFVNAVEEYKKAITHAPENAVFHSNLSLAYKNQKMWKEAIQKLDDKKLLDKDEQAYKEEVALILNLEGNDFYSKGQYREAAEKYSESIEYYPQFDIVYKNLAGAWENLNEPGALTNAIDALTKAAEINQKNEYDVEIEILKRKKMFIESFGEISAGRINIVNPLSMEVAMDLVPYVEADGALLDNVTVLNTTMRDEVLSRFGVRLPGTLFRQNKDFLSGTYVIILMEVPLVLGTIYPDERFTPDKDRLSEINIIGRNGVNPLTREEGSWIKKEDWHKAEENGLELWDIMEYPIKHLQSVIEVNLIEFVGNQEVINSLGEAYTAHTFDVEVAERHAAFTNVCRELVNEKTPIKHIKKIHETFEELLSSGHTLLQIVEKIRSLAEVSHELPGNEKSYTRLRLGESFESEIENSIYSADSYAVLAMEPEECQKALTAVRKGTASITNPSIVVERNANRPFVRKLIEIEFPNVPVLSMNELKTSDSSIVGKIELDEAPSAIKRDFEIRKSVANEHSTEINGVPAKWDNLSDKEAPVTITLFICNDLLTTQSPADDRSLKELLELMNDGLFYELGIILPVVQVNGDVNLDPKEFRIFINDKEFKLEGIGKNEFLVNDTPDRLKLLKVTGKSATNPANGYACSIVEGSSSLQTCKKSGLATWGPAGYIILYLSYIIRRNAGKFQQAQTTQFMLDSLTKSFPDLVEISLKKFSVEKICAILRELLAEEISIRDLRSILDSLLSITGTTDIDTGKYIIFTPQVEGLCFTDSTTDLEQLTAIDYVNYVRMSLKRYISHKYTKGQSTMIVYLLDTKIEQRLADIKWNPLDDKEKNSLIKAVADEVGSLPPSSQKPVILTRYDVRKPLKNLIEEKYPDLTVLSYQELSFDLNIQPVARISWE